MPDIFISYSRKDAGQAQQLTELLAAAGLSVWIDRYGIAGSSQWATEIVEGIRSCSTFILLLSPRSIESENVLRELSLASEKRKRVLPVYLEPTVLPSSFEYPLAGLQHLAISDFDKIVHAHHHGLAKFVPKDTRKSLIILPFEDLSPSQDNGWFTDGMASELVSTLSHVKSLRLIDWNTSRLVKNKSIPTIEIAKDFSVRYFVEGQVRKFGDQIRISVALLDIETGDHLWQDSITGTMKDVFDIQETVAKKVLAGLDVILTKKEEEKVTKKPTDNAEAYELFLRGKQYYGRATKPDFERALGLFDEAARLDPNFAMAFGAIADTCQEIYRHYSRTPMWLERAEAATEQVREVEGETAMYFAVMSVVTLQRGDAKAALGFAKRSVAADVEYAPAYEALGFAYKAVGQKEEAVSTWEKYVSLRENNTTIHFGLLAALNELPGTPEQKERLRIAAERAILVYKRHVRLTPDDYNARVEFSNVLQWARHDAEALDEAKKLSAIESLDGFALYNLACLYLHLGDASSGIAALRRAMAKQFRNIEVFRRDPDLDPLRDPSSPFHAEFETCMKELDKQYA